MVRQEGLPDTQFSKYPTEAGLIGLQDMGEAIVVLLLVMPLGAGVEMMYETSLCLLDVLKTLLLLFVKANAQTEAKRISFALNLRTYTCRIHQASCASFSRQCIRHVVHIVN